MISKGLCSRKYRRKSKEMHEASETCLTLLRERELKHCNSGFAFDDGHSEKRSRFKSVSPVLNAPATLLEDQNILAN